jgi:DNA-binding Xre family transcriptional regulator
VLGNLVGFSIDILGVLHKELKDDPIRFQNILQICKFLTKKSKTCGTEAII